MRVRHSVPGRLGCDLVTGEVDVIRDLYTRFRVLIHEVTKFGIVGALAFVIYYGGTNSLHYGLHIGPLTSVIIAGVVSTLFAFVGNRNWAFRHRKGNKRLSRESALFFFFNAVGLGIQLGVVAITRYGFGLTDKLSYQAALVVGVGAATLFRLLSYHRWVFNATEAGPPAAEQLEPETTTGR